MPATRPRIRIWYYRTIADLPDSYLDRLQSLTLGSIGLMQGAFTRDQVQFRTEPRHIIVATHNGLPIGWIYTALGKNLMFFVHPGYRKMGIAYKMLCRWVRRTNMNILHPYRGSNGVYVAERVKRTLRIPLDIVEASTFEF